MRILIATSLGLGLACNLLSAGPALSQTGTSVRPLEGVPDRVPPSARFPVNSLSLNGVTLGGGVPGSIALAERSTGGLAVKDEPSGGLRFTLAADVLFDFDRATLRPDADAALRQLLDEARRRIGDNATFRVEGHTDSMGSDPYNQRLSLRRARAVGEWLVRRAEVPPRSVVATGHGERRPIAPNTAPDGSDDAAGRQRNRRVEIVVRPR